MREPELTSFPVEEADLVEINRYARKKLTAQEVYTFRIILCDNEIDRDLERFETKALAPLAQLFVGKTGIFDHSMRSKDQTARIYAAEVVTQADRLTQCGETYAYIRAKAYMLRTEKNADLIAEIEAGIKKETSVGCSVSRVLCSVCREELKSSKCGHKRGANYDGVPCHAVLCEPTDAYEWSFVAVPAQRGAGVTKAHRQTITIDMDTPQDLWENLQKASGSITLSRVQAQALGVQLEQAQCAQKEAALYRESLQQDIVCMTASLLPDLPE